MEETPPRSFRPLSSEQMALRECRMRIWKYNSFSGHCAMALTHLQGMLRSDTLTPEAQAAAKDALTSIDRLAHQLEKRRD